MISLQILNNDILESEKHMNFLKNTFEINNDIKNYIQEYVKDDFTISNLNKLSSTEILNFHAIITISQLEISLVLKSLHFSKSDFEKIYRIKHSYLIIYATFNTLNILKRNLSEMYDNKAIAKEYAELNKLLREFRKFVDIENKVKNIRNKISEHITSNFSEYYSFIEVINIEDDIDKLIRFRLVLNQLNDFLFKLVIKPLIQD